MFKSLSSLFSFLWLKTRICLIRCFGVLASYLAKREAPLAFKRGERILLQNGRYILVFNPVTTSIKSSCQTNIYVNLHPGGFVAGKPIDCSEFCCSIADQCQCIVIAPEYGLAPEFPFPHGINDCVNAVEWCLTQYGTQCRLAIGGFSAGGCLTYGVCQKVKTLLNKEVDCAISFYPPMNFSSTSDNDFTEKNPLKRNVFHQAYLLGIEQRQDETIGTTDQPIEKLLQDPILSPTYSDLSLLPKSIVFIAAEQDPNIRDMKEFMERVKESYNQKENYSFTGKIFEGVFHGWDSVPKFALKADQLEKKAQAYEIVRDELIKVFNK